MKIIDMHAHIWMHKKDVSKRKILKAAEVYGLDKVFVSTLIAPIPTVEEVKLVNSVTFDFVREAPEVIRGYTYVSPEHKNALDVLRRGIEDDGAVGIKVWISDYFNSPNMNPLAEALIDYGMPVLIHAFRKTGGSKIPTENTSVEVRELALRYPELKIVMAHIDGNYYHGVGNVRDIPNIAVDISGGPHKTREVEYAVEHLGADRVLFGSDMSENSLAVPLGKTLEANITDAEREKIFYKNTERIFELGLKNGDR